MFFYVTATIGPFLGGNCGPEGFFGPEGHLAGGAHDSALGAAAVGGVLWAAAGTAVWWLHERRGAVILAFTVLYVVALIVLWYAVSPAIWGAQYCDIS